MSVLYSVDTFGNPISGAAILNVLDLPTPATGPLAGNFMVKIPDGISVNNPTHLGTGLSGDTTGLLTQKYQGLLAFYASFTSIVYDDLLDTTFVDLTGPSTGGLFGSRSNIKLNPGGVLQSLTVNLAVTSGTTAAIASVSTPTAILTGLTGMTPGLVGQQITLTGATNAQNNGTFTIEEVLSPTSIEIVNASAVFPDASSGSIDWSLAPPAQALVTWETFSITQSDVETGPVTRTYTEVSSDPAISGQVSFDGGSTWLPVTDGMVINIPALNQGTNFKIQLTNTTTNALNLGSWALLY